MTQRSRTDRRTSLSGEFEQPTVLYRDDVFLAVFKPAFMLVHRGMARDKVVMTDILKAYLGVGTVYPLHRLDRQTSGVLLCALDPVGARAGAELFASQRVQKQYVALVRGVAPDSGVIDHPVPVRENGDRVDARTRFIRLSTVDSVPRSVSLVRAYPQTGRFHQIRRHLKHIDHPVIGDANYGKGALNREIRRRYGLERLALHAEKVSFSHPFTGEMVSIVAALPHELTIPLTRLGFSLQALDVSLDGTG